jgi:hypothetical protein
MDLIESAAFIEFIFTTAATASNRAIYSQLRASTKINQKAAGDKEKLI